MQWSHIEANWNQAKNAIKETWKNIGDDDLNQIKGQRDRMIETLVERYNVDRSQAETMLAYGIDGIEIQGEGDYRAAKKFQDAQHNFAKSFSRNTEGTSS